MAPPGVFCSADRYFVVENDISHAYDYVVYVNIIFSVLKIEVWTPCVWTKGVTWRTLTESLSLTDRHWQWHSDSQWQRSLGDCRLALIVAVASRSRIGGGVGLLSYLSIFVIPYASNQILHVLVQNPLQGSFYFFQRHHSHCVDRTIKMWRSSDIKTLRQKSTTSNMAEMSRDQLTWDIYRAT